MLYYDRIDVGVYKTSESKECDCYCYGNAILNINGADYRFIISWNSKSEVVNLLQNWFIRKKWNTVNFKIIKDT